MTPGKAALPTPSGDDRSLRESRPRTWWWEVKMTVPLRVSMPRWLYRRAKPWLIRYGVEIKRAGVRFDG